MNHQKPKSVTVIGAGVSGLAVGYYATKKGFNCKLYEKSNHWGGNCITFDWQGFRYDSGAHRVHDRDAQITKEVIELLGDQLHEVVRPSRIYNDGFYISFPPRLGEMFTKMPLMECLKGVADFIVRIYKLERGLL